MNRIGMNTAASDVVIVRIVKPISFEPVERRLERRLARLHVAHDVLEHHDRVVDDEADREDERHHRQVVEAVVQQLHDGEGAEDRERQRERRNERRRAVVQEEKDDADDQDERDRASSPGCRVNASRMVFERSLPDDQVHRRRQLRLRAPAARARTASATSMTLVPGCFCTSSVIDALLAVLREQPGALRRRLDAVDDVGDLLEPHRPAVAVGDDDRPERRRRCQQPSGSAAGRWR